MKYASFQGEPVNTDSRQNVWFIPHLQQQDHHTESLKERSLKAEDTVEKMICGLDGVVACNFETELVILIYI